VLGADMASSLLTYADVRKQVEYSNSNGIILLVLLDGLDDTLPRTIVMEECRQTDTNMLNRGIHTYWTIPQRMWNVNHIETTFHPFGWIQLHLSTEQLRQDYQYVFVALIISGAEAHGYGTACVYQKVLTLAANESPYLGNATRQNLNGIIGKAIRTHYKPAYLKEIAPHLSLFSSSPPIKALRSRAQTADVYHVAVYGTNPSTLCYEMINHPTVPNVLAFSKSQSQINQRNLNKLVSLEYGGYEITIPFSMHSGQYIHICYRPRAMPGSARHLLTRQEIRTKYNAKSIEHVTFVVFCVAAKQMQSIITHIHA
jgi:hypothetical protein